MPTDKFPAVATQKRSEKKPFHMLLQSCSPHLLRTWRAVKVQLSHTCSWWSMRMAPPRLMGTEDNPGDFRGRTVASRGLPGKSPWIGHPPLERESVSPTAWILISVWESELLGVSPLPLQESKMMRVKWGKKGYYHPLSLLPHWFPS